MAEENNTMHAMMKGSTYGEEKVDKSNELNDTMSIAPSSKDSYESKIHSLGGNE